MSLFQKELKDFLSYITSEKGLSKNTQIAYQHDLIKFFKHLEPDAPKSVSEINQEHVITFLKSLESVGYKESSQARALIAIKVFFHFLKREEYIDQDLGQYLDTPKLWQTLPDVLSHDEMKRLLEQPKLDTFNGLRDKAILELLYSTGIRVSELCSLSIYDVDDEFIKVKGKGSKERIVPLGTKAIDAIDTYLMKAREFCSSAEENRLFLSKRGKPLDRISVWQLIKEYAKKAQITKNIFPHTFRHTYATHMLDGGADLRVIQDLLGHAHISSTDRYTHVSMSKVQELFQALHPRWKDSKN